MAFLPGITSQTLVCSAFTSDSSKEQYMHVQDPYQLRG